MEHVENALDIIASPAVNATTLEIARRKCKQNFGADYSEGKFLLLIQEINEDGWSEERFDRTLKWFLRNKPYPAWTIADWFAYSIPIHNYAWYLKQSADRVPTMTWELAPGVFGYTPAGVDLPFKNVTR